MKKLQAVLFGLAISWASGVMATTYNTATPTSSALLGLGAKLYCNNLGCTSVQPGDLTGYVTLSAWSTPTAAANTTTSPTENPGTWIQAQLAIYGGGIGISNQVQTGASAECFGCSPQHAIDNKIVDDILVVDFGSTGWDVSSFSLGYTCNMDAAGTGCSSSTVGVQAWIGGQNGTVVNFASESFDANGLTGKPMTGNFSALSLSPDPVTSNVAIMDSTSTTGRYLVITGALGAGMINGVAVNGYSDAFKVKDIVATKTGGPGGGSVPTPGSFALLALGLFALAFARRRVAVTS